MDTKSKTGSTTFRWVQRGLTLLTAMGAMAFVTITDSWAEESAKNGNQSVSFARQAENLRISVSRGDADAKYQLAELYERGLGVPQNFAQAIHLYREAAMNGHVLSRRRLASLGVSLFPAETTTTPSTGPESEIDGQPLRFTISRSEHVSRRDTGVFASSQSIFSREIFIVVRPGHKKRRRWISRHHNNLTGWTERHIQHGSLGVKEQRKRPVGLARSGATGHRIH